MKSFPILTIVTILTVAVLLLYGSGSASEEQLAKVETKRVLVLYSYHEGLQWEKLINESFRDALTSQSSIPIDINVEHTDRIKYRDDGYRDKIVDLYRYKYSHPKMDLIIGIDDEAVELLLDFGEALFPDIPILLVTAKRKNHQRDSLKPNMISLQWGIDFRSNVELIGELLPQTRHIFVVAGSSASDRETVALAQESIGEDTKQFTIHYLTDMSVEELSNRLTQLPKQSVIFYLVFSRDAEGQSVIPLEIAAILSRQANVPVFGLVSTYLGHGVVGGNMLSAAMEGKRCAEIALSILKGKFPENIDQHLTVHQLMFDWRQLKRWGIKENSLPPGSVVQFEIPSIWKLCRGYVVAALVFILIQSGLITYLLKQRAQLRHTQSRLTGRLQFEEMLAGLSARFVNLPPDRVDEEIAAVLASISKHLYLNRVSVYKFLHKERQLQLIQSHRYGETMLPPFAIDFEQIPWIMQKIFSGENVMLSNLEDLPPEACADKEFLRANNIVSLTVFPLFTADRTLGALSLGTTGYSHNWSNDIHWQYPLVAEVLTNALLRKQYEESLLNAEKKYRTVADFTYDWEYWVNKDDSLEYISPSCERISGYTPRDFMDNPSLLSEIILPEDRDVWNRHQHDSRQELRVREVEFRIRRVDGEIRWIEHNCQPVTDHHGHLNGFRASNRDITARKQIEQEIREREKDLRMLATRLISAHEEERRSLARELHDDLSQRLAALAIEAGRMEQQAVNQNVLDTEAYSMLRDQIIAIANDVHSLSRQLHPSILDDLGLTRAVESQCTRFSNREGIEVAFTAENIPNVLPKAVSLSIYRIVQEGLNNIAKHACARRVEIALQKTDGNLSLSIQDDGIGFVAAEVLRKQGLGLSSMRERVRIIHGELNIASEPEKGATIEVRVPLEIPGNTEATLTDPE